MCFSGHGNTMVMARMDYVDEFVDLKASTIVFKFQIL